MPLSRARVVQGLLSLYAAPRYLEIGVSQGATFHSVKAARKVAVDPQFDFDVAAARSSQPEAHYHAVTSDEYFGRIAGPSERFDVIFLDGLHTFEQTLRDFTNAIYVVAPNGVIVIDDITPDSHFAAIRDLTIFRTLRVRNIATSASWMGDVYRLAFFIETFFQQLSYRTVADNHGQLIVWRGRRPSVPERSVEAIARTTYEDVILQTEVFRLVPFAEIVTELRDHLELPAPPFAGD
jgi:hypothetical protein